MPVTKLKEFLDRHAVPYETITHSKTFTSQDTAEVAHVPGKELAKTVMVWLDDRMAMAVLPSSSHIDLGRLQEACGARRVVVATENEFRDLFPNCEVGAMPPFGNLWDMPVFVATTLAEDDQIAFNAGNHTELIRLSYADYERLVQPTVMEFAAQLA